MLKAWQPRSFLGSRPPSVAVEIAARRVTAVAVSGRGPRLAITGHATEYLGDAAVIPALNAQNVPEPGPVADAVRRAVSRVGGRNRRIGLILPDSIAKVSFVRFEQVPGRSQDLDQLIRWQIRKTAPFRVEDAQISYGRGAATKEGTDFAVVVARRDIVEEYERVCSTAGLHAGLVDLATPNLINLVLAGGPIAGDWLLVHVTAEYVTLAIVRDADLIYFRNLRAEGEGSLTDFVHQTAMYYEDRLKGAGFTRALLVGTADAGASVGEAEEIRASLGQRLGARVETVDPRAVAEFKDRIVVGPELLEALASPVGLLVRESAA